MTQIVSPTMPKSPKIGDRWVHTISGMTFEYQRTASGGGAWVQIIVPGHPPMSLFDAPIITNDTPKSTQSQFAPANPDPGDFWYHTETGVEFIFYDDGTTRQWVTTQPTKAGDIVVVTGPAGGDLAGSYPNPTIKDDVELGGVPTLETPPDASAVGNEIVTADWVNDAIMTAMLGDVEWDNIQNKPSTFPPSAHTQDWSTITGTPATFPPTLPIPQSGVTDLTTDLASKVAKTGDTMTGTLIGTKIALGGAVLGSNFFAVQGNVDIVGNINASGYLQAGSANPIGFYSRSQMYSPADNTMRWTNNANSLGVQFSWATAGLLSVKDRTGAADVSLSFKTETAGDSSTKGATTAFVGAAISALAIGNYQLKSEKNAVNGYAGLDGTGKVPSSLLPAYVDDVLEFANLAAFPATGATGVIYVALDTNKVYRWGGSSYTEISPSPGSSDAVPEGSINLYYTAARQALKADIASPIFTGDPKAPTPATADNDTSIATTAFVKAQSYETTANVALKVSKAGDTMTGTLTGTLGTITASTPVFNGSQTWNNAAVDFIGWTLNITDTAQGANSRAFRIQRSGSDVFAIDRFGTLITGGGIYNGDVVQSWGKHSANVNTAPPAGGDLAMGQFFSNVTNFGVLFGTGAPNKAAAAGSIYLRRDGPPQYNTDGTAGGWSAMGGGAAVHVGTTAPASPSAGQLWWHTDLGQMFIYYNDGSTTQWVPASPAASAQNTLGTFMATSTSNAISTSEAVHVFATVICGNAGSYYNTSNGRYTPPAGRYYVSASMRCFSSSSGIISSLTIRKNGTGVNWAEADAAAANRFGNPQVDAIVDMNGTDYIEITMFTNVLPSGSSIHTFKAHPVSGM